MAECPKCEGFGSVCLECGMELVACECGKNSKPWKCEECHGRGTVNAQIEMILAICTFPDCASDCPGRQPAEIAA